MKSRGEILRKYALRPFNHLNLFDLYDNEHQYEQLNSASENSLTGSSPQLPDDFQDHRSLFRNSLSQDDVQAFLRFFSESTNIKSSATKYLPLVRRILTPEIDNAIKAYFGSEYTVMWASWGEIKNSDDQNLYFKNWHCDVGPSRHLKTITYMNSTTEHKSSTLLGDLASTQKLKEIGYVMNDIKTRQNDISDLVDFFDINFQPEEIIFDAGDTLLFNPTQRLHRAELPEQGAVRYSFCLCIIPSPVPWEVAFEKGLEFGLRLTPFEGYAQKVLALIDGEKENREIVTRSTVAANVARVRLDHKSTITDGESLHHHLKMIFRDAKYAQRIANAIINGSGGSINFTLHELLMKLKCSFQSDLNWQSYFSLEDMRNLEDLLRYERQQIDASSRFNTKNKPKADAIMWPIPNHEKYPKCKFDMLPYVNKHKIMAKETPIGSAGSCFAFEIAEFLQSQEFNYVVEERADNPENGVFVDGYKAGDRYAKFSANYGLLFNTPSLKQLAEKAFGLRSFTRYSYRDSNNIVIDPYRENVYFASESAFQNDYQKHVDAVRRSLLNSKVFIFTAGLNECWQMHDGTTISRNPKDGYYHLLKHRVLTVQENVDNIRSFVDIVRQHNPEFKLIVSLSPVPLLATGRAETHHIIEANTHSKSVLRVAIDQLVNEMDGVYYLPSYELIMECTENPWKEDHRHVKKEVVSRVIEMFKEMFVH